MCGLFGLVRNSAATHPQRASTALTLLGRLAQERGLDASGLAFLRTQTSAPDAFDGEQCLAAKSDITLDGCRIVKRVGSFRRLWRPTLSHDLDRAAIVIGHTRWATQGSATRLSNAAPLLAGSIVGTHNGDIDAFDLRMRYGLPRSADQTDSQAIFEALAEADPLEVLRDLRGRAALAWADLDHPRHLYLARAALSPLAVATDDEGNLFWASNPGWLRTVAKQTFVRMNAPVMLPEGTWLVIRRAKTAVTISSCTSFIPTARARDVTARVATWVWRGFTTRDRLTDQAQIRHTIADDDPPRWLFSHAS